MAENSLKFILRELWSDSHKSTYNFFPGMITSMMQYLNSNKTLHTSHKVLIHFCYFFVTTAHMYPIIQMNFLVYSLYAIMQNNWNNCMWIILSKVRQNIRSLQYATFSTLTLILFLLHTHKALKPSNKKDISKIIIIQSCIN